MNVDRTVFISYAHQDNTQDRVAGFAQFLHDSLPSKIEILLDKKYLGIGKNIPNFMGLLESCPVALLLMTPEYKRRVENAIGGVFSEYEIIRKRMANNDDDLLCLPVLFEGTMVSSVPNLFTERIYEDYTKFHPRLKSIGVNKYFLSDVNRVIFIPKFKDIARAIESKISVRSVLPQPKYRKLLETLFAKTKISREWIKIHPEFSNHLFVATRSYDKVREQDAVFLIGRKGSGKSTIASTMPQLEYERYKASIPILADHINLLSTIELINARRLHELHYSLASRFEKNVSEFLKFHPRFFLFKFGWLGLFYICLAQKLCSLGEKEELNEAQMAYYCQLKVEYDKFTFFQSKNIHASKYFNCSCIAFSEFWDEIITKSLDLSSYSEAIRYIDSNINEDNFLRYFLNNDLLDAIKTIVSLCDKKALITLDDFDSVFSVFRKSINELISSDFSTYFTKNIETSWIQSLMILILELKGYRKGWCDELFSKIDFCITIPRDSYAQVLYEDRDAFLNIEYSATLDWTGLYLAQMLLKRLCYIYGEESADDKNVFSELNRVIRTYIKKLPTALSFEFNGENITIDLFIYVLRHSFWRPRDILTYFAALLTAASSCPDQERLSVEQIRRIIGVATKNILRTEFLGEFKEVISNLDEVIEKFRNCQQVISHELLYKLIGDQNIMVGSRNIVKNFNEKLRILYEIGFIGLHLTETAMLMENTLTNECFYFNEGSTIFDSMIKFSFDSCRFIIHPIFVEELRLNYHDNKFILNWNEEYLRDNHVVKTSVLDAY